MRLRHVGALVLVALSGALVAATAAHASTDDGTDIGIVVTTTTAPGGQNGGGSTPGGSNGGSATGTGTNSGRSSGGSSTTGGSSSAPDAGGQLTTEAIPGDKEVDLGGVLFLSGLKAVYVPSIDPLGGRVDATFTIRNATAESIAGTAVFELTGPFGNRIGDPVDVRIDDIPADSTIDVSAPLRGVGQWTFVTATGTFTPPAEVAGNELSPVSRDVTLLAFPWLLPVLVAVALLVYAALRIRRAIIADSAPVPSPSAA